MSKMMSSEMSTQMTAAVLSAEPNLESMEVGSGRVLELVPQLTSQSSRTREIVFLSLFVGFASLFFVLV